MDKEFEKKLFSLEYERFFKDLYGYSNPEKLFTTQNRWLTFVFFENGKYYMSNESELVENFDAPDIDVYYMIEVIKTEIAKFGCTLNIARITKEFEIQNFEKALEEFKNAVFIVDDLYKKIVNHEF